MQEALLAVSYLLAAVLFILSLRGLASQETARPGNLYGMTGMAIALAATLVAVAAQSYALAAAAIVLGGMLQLTGPQSPALWLGAIAVFLASINIAGGFLVTQRMLRMFRR